MYGTIVRHHRVKDRLAKRTDMSKTTFSAEIIRIRLALTAAISFLLVMMASAPAMAFVNPSHSAQGVYSSATMYSGQSMP